MIIAVENIALCVVITDAGFEDELESTSVIDGDSFQVAEMVAVLALDELGRVFGLRAGGGDAAVGA